jgi:hypothetical protein
LDYKRRFQRFEGKRITRKFDSKNLTLGQILQYQDDDDKSGKPKSPTDDNKCSKSQREYSLKVISTQQIGTSQTNQGAYDSLTDSSNSAYYSYLKNNYTTIDQIVYSTSKSLLGKRCKYKTLGSTEATER